MKRIVKYEKVGAIIGFGSQMAPCMAPDNQPKSSCNEERIKAAFPGVISKVAKLTLI